MTLLRYSDSVLRMSRVRQVLIAYEQLIGEFNSKNYLMGNVIDEPVAKSIYS